MSGPLPRNINTLPAATEANDTDLLILRQFDGVSAWQDKKISIGTIKPFLAEVSIMTQDNQTVSGVAFKVFGVGPNDVPVMDTYLNDDDEIIVENRTWETAYVMDLNADPGNRGTFTDLQTCIDAIVADGVATDNMIGIIHFKPGEYQFPDEIIIPDNVLLGFKGTFNAGALGNTLFDRDARIDVKITNGENSILYFQDIYVSGIAEFPSIISSSGAIYGKNASMRDMELRGTSQNDFQDCSALGFQVYDGASAYVSNCTNVACTINAGSGTFDKCDDLTVLQGIDGFTQVIITNCKNVNSVGDAGGPLSTCFIYNSSMAQQIFNSSILYVSGLSASAAGLQGGGNFFDDSCKPTLLQTIKANTYVTRIVDTSGPISMYDHFIGVNGYSGAVNLDLMGSLDTPCKGQSWVIGDLQGNASSEPITITPFSGLINGQSSLVINEDFGAVEIYFDGTNYFAIFANSAISETLSSLTVNGKITMNGPQVIKVTEVDDDYNILTSDFAVAVTDTTAPRSLQLPVTGSSNDQTWEVKDRSGNASVNAITITAEGGALIDNQANILIDDDYQGWSFVFDGTNFWTR